MIAGPAKKMLRALLPDAAVVRLSRANRAVDRILASAAVGGLQACSLRVRVLTRELLSGTRGRLDYDRAPIDVFLSSEAELARLRPCLKEPETVAWIEDCVRPGDVLFDVGANIGAYSLVADRATGSQCRIYAFEPSFSTYAQLCRNIALNGCAGRIVPLLVALSDTNGLLPFNYSSLDPGSAMHALGESVDSLGRPFQAAFVQPVPGYRMDDLITHLSLPSPTHIKLDVDGVELKVLRGAAGVLAHPRLRSVMVEVEPTRPDLVGIERVLGESGFTVHARYPHGAAADSTTNVLFTRPNASC
jgi:FkbM family methyltransferase